MALHRLHRFFYSTSFTLLFLFLCILLLITPADAVVQAYFRNRQLYNVFVIAGTYLLTAALALAIYVSRIYSVRTLMAEIPKSYIPVKKLDLPKRVHKAVTGNLSRSAVIAVQSRPCASTLVGPGGTEITHPGWSPPSSKDLPDVHYLSVILELPHLIEAKAVSLQQSPGQDFGREQHMTLRAYLAHLVVMGVVGSVVVDVFIGGYERARFRTRGEGVEEGEFRELMKVFAGLLRGMGAHEPVLEEEERWATDDEDDVADGRSGGVDRDEEEYSEGGSVRRGFGFMSLYETTTTDYEEEDGTYGNHRDNYPGRAYQRAGFHPYAEQYGQRERERFVERERSRVRSGLGGALMERNGTQTTVETSSMGSRNGGSYEMQSLSPRGMNRLSVRVSTGTFG